MLLWKGKKLLREGALEKKKNLLKKKFRWEVKMVGVEDSFLDHLSVEEDLILAVEGQL